jgi:hypothetical protein
VGSTVVVGWWLGLALLLLVALGAVVALLGGLGWGVGRGVVTAAARAVVQLAVVSAVIVAVVRTLWLSAAFVVAMTPQRSRQPSDEGGEDRPVGPVQARSWVGPAQHCDLAAQHEELDVLGGGLADRE